MPETTETIEVNLGPEDCYAKAVDFAGYTNFIPALKNVDVQRQDDREAEVTFRIEAPLGEIRYTLRYKMEPPRSIRYEMTESNILKKVSGFWEISAAGEGKANVTYSMSTTFPTYLAWAVTDKAYAEQIGKTVRRFKEWAES
jgi:ribosome-associated toxin RatA of RatAB toxin-antitoxin module